MLKSPLSGFRTLFKAVQEAIASIYAVKSLEPETVLDFENEYYKAGDFDTAVTHARNSNATMVDSDGLLKWAPHNDFLYSQDFSNAAWNKSDLSVDDNSGAGYADPDGGLSAVKIIATANNGSIRQIVVDYSTGNTAAIFSLIDGSLQTNLAGSFDSVNVINEGNGWWKFECKEKEATLSVYAKAAEWNYIVIQRTSNLNYFYPAETSTSSGNADGVSGIYLWGAHLYRSDLGGMVDNPDRGDSYVPTTTSARYLPRRGHHVYNGTTWVNEGLLVESEQRVNLQTYSNDLSQWTNTNTTDSQNQATSPTGEIDANFLNETATNSSHFISSPTVTYTSGSVYTVSFFVKASGRNRFSLSLPNGPFDNLNRSAVFDLAAETATPIGTVTSNIEKLDGGWYRCSLTQTAIASSSGYGMLIFLTLDDGTTSYLGDVTKGLYIYGAQVESASTPSSYIPTSGAAVTRAAETLTVPAAQLPWPEPNVIGSELVTNGTFDTDTTGWTPLSGAVISYSAEQMVVSTLSGDIFGSATQEVTTEVGKVYRITADVLSSTANAQIRVGTTTGSLDLLASDVAAAPFSFSGVFIATSVTTYVTAVTRDASECSATFDNISVKESDPISVSIQMDGRITYADTDAANEVSYLEWVNDASNRILLFLDTDRGTGGINFFQEALGVNDRKESDGSAYSPGILVPYNLASRHGSTFINGAVSGTALTANTTPTALPDLSTTDLDLAYDYNGTIRLFRVWANDLGDDGIEEAST